MKDHPEQKHRPVVRYRILDPYSVKDLEAVLRRAHQNGVNPDRVLIALGVDPALQAERPRAPRATPP
jgi:hypothetical protein